MTLDELPVPRDDDPHWRIPPGWTATSLHWTGSLCRSCDAPVLFLRHLESGKYSPFDPAVGEEFSVTHFATCPQAASHRRKR